MIARVHIDGLTRNSTPQVIRHERQRQARHLILRDVALEHRELARHRVHIPKARNAPRRHGAKGPRANCVDTDALFAKVVGEKADARLERFKRRR